MKKLIPAILLAASASSSLLLAQSEYDQVTGYRLQATGSRRTELRSEDNVGEKVKTTTNYNDQVTGDRLQVAGINQDTDYRAQIEEYSLTDDSTPIFHLPSPISYLGVTPKLMMDPLTIGKSAEALGEELGVVGEKVASGKTAISTSEVASSPASSSSFSEEGGISTFTADYSEVIATSERALDRRQLGTQAHATGKQNEGNSWDSASKSFQLQVDYHTKAMEAREAGNEALAAGYEQAAIISRRAAEKQEQSALAFAAGQKEEGHSWFWSGSSLQAKADYEAKSYEAEETGQVTLAEGYRNAAAISGQAADQWELSAETKAAGKISESNIWGRLGYSLQAKADYEVQACEAQIAGRSTLAEGYRNSAVISREAADQLKLSAETKAVGKISEVNSLVWLGDTLQSQADYEAQACEAQEAEGDFLADKYRDIIKILESAVKYQKQAVSAFVMGKEDEGADLLDIGKFLRSKADNYKKALEARRVGNEEMAFNYEGAAMMPWRPSEQQKQSVLAYARRKDKAANGYINIWGRERAVFQEQAACLAKVIQAREVKKEALAANYEEAASILGRSADQFGKAAEAFLVGKEKEGNALKEGADSLVLQAKCQKRVFQAQESENNSLVVNYRKAIEILEKATGYHQQAVSACVMGQEEESAGWVNVGKFLRSQADDQVKIAEALEKKKSVISEIKKDNRNTITLGADEDSNSEPLTKKQRIIGTDTMKKMALSICCEKWLAETKSAEGQDKTLSDYVINVLKRGADCEVVKSFEEHCEHIAKVRELGDYSLALAWIQVAEDIQQAIKDSIQGAQTSKNKGWRVTEAWKITVQAGQKLAKYREKYIQVAASLKNPEIIVGSKKIIEGLETIIIYYRKAAEAYSLGNEQEYDRFRKVAYCANENIEQLEKTVNAFKKSIDAAAEGEVKMSIFWRKIAEQREKLAESYKQVILFKLSENFTIPAFFKDFSFDCSIFAGQSDGQLNEASLALEKTTEAKKAGQPEIADLWFKSGEYYQKSAEYCYKAIVDISKSTSHFSYDNYYSSVRFLIKNVADQSKKAVSAQENAIQAMAINQKQLAAEWIKIATQYQESAEYFSKALSAIDPDCISEEGDSITNREELLNLKTEIEAGNLSQYTLSQDLLNEPSPMSAEAFWRAMPQGIPQPNKTILEQSPYGLASSSITVSRMTEAFASLKKIIRAMEENEKELKKLWDKTANLKGYEWGPSYIPEEVEKRERIKNSVFWSKLTY